MSVLYITYDGVTDHIGRSQVAPYVIGLAQRGFPIHVLSAEKPGREALIEQYQQIFDAVGVKWTRVAYRNRPPILAQAWTQWQMKRAARRIIASEDVQALHCRSFHPALIAHELCKSSRMRYIFDFRDFYADGGMQKARGIRRLVFRRLKQLEGPMIQSASKVVCLTERAKVMLCKTYLSNVENPSARFQVIPCCADFTHFDTAQVTADAQEKARAHAGVHDDDVVLLYLGSLGPDYLLPEMFKLFRALLEIEPNAKFLFVSNNGRKWVDAERTSQKIPETAVIFVSVDRDEVPAYISLADLAVVFIRADDSKAGCSPTKLAELLACNVPVIGNTGVGDLDAILQRGRNGSLVVRDFSPEALRQAASELLQIPKAERQTIRDRSRDFSLEVGVAKYAEVYRELLESAPTSKG
jgi:glycosyltransferase involved in cell wall biosynthesis